MNLKLNVKQVIFNSAVKGWDYRELADRAGLSNVTISLIKNGKTCSLKTANKIASALGVDLKELLESED